jgi:hypothetical protein
VTRYLTGAEYTDLVAVREQLHTVLGAAMDERRERDAIVQDGANFNPAWVVYEREAMLATVNAERRGRGLDKVDVSEVMAAEEQACGHVDYAAKWAAGCARLAVGLEE